MKKLSIALLCIMMVFCFAGCGNSEIDEGDEVPVVEEELEVVEETPVVDVNWQTLEKSYETSDGYQINREVKISPLVSSDEPEVLQSLWEQIDGEGDYPTPEELNMDEAVGDYTYDEVLYAFGTLEAKNITDNFSITEECEQTVPAGAYPYPVDEEGHAGNRGYGGGLYSAGSASRIFFYFGNGVKSYYSIEQGPQLTMGSDHWGPIPILVVVPNQHTPNNPDGDPMTDRMYLGLGDYDHVAEHCATVHLEKY